MPDDAGEELLQALRGRWFKPAALPDEIDNLGAGRSPGVLLDVFEELPIEVLDPSDVAELGARSRVRLRNGRRAVPGVEPTHFLDRRTN